MTTRAWTPVLALLLLLISGSTPLTAERQAPESSRSPKHDFRGLEPGKFVTYRSRDYVTPVFNFNTTEEGIPLCQDS